MSFLADIIGILLITLVVFICLCVFLPFIYFAQPVNQQITSNQKPAIKEMPLFQIESDQEPKYEFVGEFTITGYCSCEKCCGEYAENRPVDKDGNEIVYGAAMVPLVEGLSIAADTSIFPFGTEIFIDGNKYIVQDRGGAIKGNKLDIYFSDHNKAENFGVQIKKVFIERVVKSEEYDRESENQILIAYDCCNY